jgi:transportin-3
MTAKISHLCKMSRDVSSQSQQDRLPPHSDDVEEERRRIYLALDVVFASELPIGTQQSPDSSWWTQRQLADRYLTSFQSISVAWIVCDRILMEESNSSGQIAQHRLFFAAHTLHTKCRTDFHQLPSTASVDSLRLSLLNHLGLFVESRNRSLAEGGTPSVTLALTTRLSLCIAALAVQMGWTTIVTDLMSNYPTLCTHICQVLPEECASPRLVLRSPSTATDAIAPNREENRFQMRDHMVASADAVFNFLNEQMKAGGRQVALSVLETFFLWIRHVPVRPESLINSPLLVWTVSHGMKHIEYMEVSADVLVEVLRAYNSYLRQNHGLITYMIPLLAQLPLETALSSDDPDTWRAYCRVITEMGESYVCWILAPATKTPNATGGYDLLPPEHRKAATSLVDWILRCATEINDLEIASITLHFWYRFVVDLDAVEPFEIRQELIDAYTPQLLLLIDACCTTLMRYPDDFDSAAADTVEELQRHRFYVSETIMDCCRLLGGDMILKRIGTYLSTMVVADKGKISNSGIWQKLESYLACIVAIHKFVPVDDTFILSTCLNLLPGLPPTILPLRRTGTSLATSSFSNCFFSDISHWFSAFAIKPVK